MDGASFVFGSWTRWILYALLLLCYRWTGLAFVHASTVDFSIPTGWEVRQLTAFSQHRTEFSPRQRTTSALTVSERFQLVTSALAPLTQAIDPTSGTISNNPGLPSICRREVISLADIMMVQIWPFCLKQRA
jgi:hypothetical protein